MVLQKTNPLGHSEVTHSEPVHCNSWLQREHTVVHVVDPPPVIVI